MSIVLFVLISLLLVSDEEKKRIVFFGDSLTAAYGLDKEDGYPALIQKKIDSLKLNYKVVNAGLTGETTAGGLRRISWILKSPVDVFVLALGGNDGLRGISVLETEKNLQAIIDKVREKNPKVKVVLAGMQAAPNMGSEFTKQFNQIFYKLSKNNKVPLIPFLLKDVGGKLDLNLPDGVHPNIHGYRIVSRNVWSVLKDQL